MKSLGEWSPEIEEAYNIMESDDSWLSDTEKYQKQLKLSHNLLKWFTLVITLIRLLV